MTMQVEQVRDTRAAGAWRALAAAAIYQFILREMVAEPRRDGR
jgi:hypothetical protein